MKKVLSLMLALVLVIGLLSACGSEVAVTTAQNLDTTEVAVTTAQNLDTTKAEEKDPIEVSPVPDDAWMQKVGTTPYSLEFLFSGEAGDVVEVNEEGAVGVLIFLDDQYQTAEQYQEYKELYYINGDVNGTVLPRIHVFVKSVDDLKKLASRPGIADIMFNYVESNW